MPSTRDITTRTYQQLRALASRYLNGSGAATLQPTALVHEAWVKLARSAEPRDRQHYLAVAASAMRQVLLDHARDRRRLKRGGERARVTMHGGMLAKHDAQVEAIALADAIQRLEELDPRAARVLELKVFGGLSRDAIASELGVSPRTVGNDWLMARAWMRCELGLDEEGG